MDVLAFLRDVIADVEGFDISIDCPCGITFIGISAEALSVYDEKTRNDIIEKYHTLLTVYLSKITDCLPEISWQSTCNGCEEFEECDNLEKRDH